MLQWFDTLLGLVVILLGASLIVMMLTQVVVTLLNLRGRNLVHGVRLILEHADPDLKQYARQVAEEALSHGLVSDAWVELQRLKPTTTIRLNELQTVLAQLADAGGTEEWRKKLVTARARVERTVTTWFDAVMDRTSQRFVALTRTWTVVFSVVVALVLHLDALRYFKDISGNAELRARLVMGADAISQRAASAFESGTRVPAIYAEAMRRLSEQDSTLAFLGAPPAFASREEGMGWLGQQAAAAGRGDRDSLVARYQAQIQQGLTRPIDQLLDQATGIRADLAAAQIELVPSPYPGLRYGFDRHLWGVLLMASLMSLGAPFWFNVLRSMSALRPILAGKEHQERKQRTSQTGLTQP
jgi:hypothetical protein